MIPVLGRASMHPDDAGCFFPAHTCGSESEELFAFLSAWRGRVQAGFVHPLIARVDGEPCFLGSRADVLQSVEGFEEGVLLLLGVFRLGLAELSAGP